MVFVRQCVCMIILVCLFTLTSNTVKAQAQGPFYTIDVRGIPMSCTSFQGSPVALYLDHTLNHYRLMPVELSAGV